MESHGTPSAGLTESEPIIGSSPAGSTQPPRGRRRGGAGSSSPHPATRAAASSATVSGFLPWPRWTRFIAMPFPNRLGRYTFSGHSAGRGEAASLWIYMTRSEGTAEKGNREEKDDRPRGLCRRGRSRHRRRHRRRAPVAVRRQRQLPELGARRAPGLRPRRRRARSPAPHVGRPPRSGPQADRQDRPTRPSSGSSAAWPTSRPRATTPT